jgi:MFS family permease
MTTNRKAWAVMLAAYLASIAIAINQSKVPPAMQVLLRSLNMDMTTGGWLMSAFALAGIVLGIPAAFILVKLGPKISGLIALGCTLLGSIVGALANGPALLLGGRVIEGMGLGLITVIAPAVISMWFPPEKRGTPMGIWASWVPVGGFIMYNLAGPLLRAFGWQSIWWFGALFALVAFVIYAVIVSAPPTIGAEDDQPRESIRSFGKMMLNPASWLLALVFGTFTFAFMGYATWVPSYYSQGLGLSLETASFYASLGSLAVIPSTIIAGRVLDRVRNRHLVMTAALAICGILLFWCFQLESANAIVPYSIVLSLVAGFVPTATFTLAPETMPDPRFAGLALGIVSVGQNLGMFLGPPMIGAVVASGNWGAGTVPLMISLAIGAAASLILRAVHTKTPVVMTEAQEL